MNDLYFDLLAIRDETFLRDVIFYEEIDSTNSALIKLQQEPVETPLLAIAQSQTNGRGRAGNNWWSNVGSLTFSLLLDFPMLALGELSSFSLTAGLSVCQAIEKHAPAADLALKWPNDVFLNDKKVAGILIEKPSASEPRLVVGIGINLNNDLSEAPSEVRQRATSLFGELGDPLDANRVLIDCLQEIERRSREQVHHREELLDQWRAYCMLTGRQIEVKSGNVVHSGRCLGIDESGALLLESEPGAAPERIATGEVLKF